MYWENFESKGKVYNPRFQYGHQQNAQSVVDEMSTVFSNRYKIHAKCIIDEVIKLFGSATKYRENVWGREISGKEALDICNNYIGKNKIKVKVFFGKSLVTTMSSNGLSLVGRPGYYRDLRLISLLDHEIGTHHLRCLNQNRLPDQTKNTLKKNKIGWQIATEEGLATLGNHLHYAKCNYLFIPALLYYGVCLAHANSFWDTFKGLFKYCADFEDCWITTIRVKRGMSDTSKPGAFCKDQSTFDGCLRILDKRKEINFHALFAGKVCLETYFMNQEILAAAAKDPKYVTPPQIRGEPQHAFFMKRLEEIYESHQNLFQ